ncbi:hypothetical protein EJ05DRAFT_474188 [Pseudovirgaria hyperparasitica]|uniref:DNA-binding protein RAP1 n=1 Tax=Pseudovirgaria hyperparasitica TaxID=470096 RepID=A0A6A6WE10_9PEZI|nr:uncharacterized protein EJ05DRAFT_474188 [Pseudovirgaria hyperparasitica]KAF2760294.1 hypothetical protein EJ05DRAFT_474188 [Pseudovirgaria hyperparasitica]
MGFIQLIKSNGGTIVSLEIKADLMIVDHMRKDTVPGGISYRYIEKSIKNGRLENPDDHATGPPKGSARSIGSLQPKRSVRTPFSAADDLELYTWVKDYENRTPGAPVMGNEIYKQLEQKNSRHTWQSWRDRYVKQLMHRPPVGYNVPERSLSPVEAITVEHETESLRNIPRDRSHRVNPKPKANGIVKPRAEEQIVNSNSFDSFDEEEYGKLYLNTGYMKSLAYGLVRDLANWNSWAEHSTHTGIQWRNYWEQIVQPDWEQDGQDGTREAKLMKYKALDNQAQDEERLQFKVHTEQSSNEVSSPSPAQHTSPILRQKSVRPQNTVHDGQIVQRPAGYTGKAKAEETAHASRTEEETLDTDSLEQGQEQEQEQDEGIRSASRKRRSSETEPHDDVPETQSQEQQPSPKRMRIGTTEAQVMDLEIEDATNAASQVSQASVIIELSSSDEDEGDVDEVLIRPLPEAVEQGQHMRFVTTTGAETRQTLPGIRQPLTDTLTDGFPDIDTSMGTSTALVSQIGETVREDIVEPTQDNLSPIDLASLIADEDVDDISNESASERQQSKQELYSNIYPDDDAHERDTPLHLTEDSSQESATLLALPPPEGGWETDEESVSASSQGSTPTHGQARPVLYDTQAILQTESQHVDLGIPEPLNMSDDEEDSNDVGPSQSRTARETSIATDASEIALDAKGIREMACEIRRQGHGHDTMMEIFRCTSNYRRLVRLVLASFKEGKGIPDDIPGIWTTEDDEALESTDIRDLERVEEKHGSGRVEERMEFLRHYRR